MMGQALVTDVAVVVGDGLRKQVGLMLPRIPARIARVARVVAGVPNGTVFAFVSVKAGLTDITRGRVPVWLWFMLVVTAVALITGKSKITRTDARAVISRMAYTIDALAWLAKRSPLVFGTQAFANAVRMLPRLPRAQNSAPGRQ